MLSNLVNVKQHLSDTTDSILENDDHCLWNNNLVILSGMLQDLNKKRIRKHRDETLLPEGTCLSPADAANCMLDTKRTVYFVRGLHSAIKHLQEKNPGKKITILYAGCGPLATLALPITKQFSHEEVGFTLVDIHEASLTHVAQLIKKLKLQDYFDNLICTDATQMEPEKEYDILISETMGRSLLFEPQLAITENLRKYIKKDGILIPEEINLGVDLIDELAFTRRVIQLGQFFVLSKDSQETSPPNHIEGTVEIPETVEQDHLHSIQISTRVKIFGTNVLSPNDSMITMGQSAGVIGSPQHGTKINIGYNGGCHEADIKTTFTKSDAHAKIRQQNK